MKTVEAGLATDLVGLLFKGLGKIFEAGAEYENDMGVLKSVTTIPVQDKDSKEYQLKIKLAPVKDMNSTYVVELSCDGLSNFDAMGKNGKAMKIDKSTKTQFEKFVDRVLAKNNLTRINDESDEADEDANSDNFYGSYEIECYDESDMTTTHSDNDPSDLVCTYQIAKSDYGNELTVEFDKKPRCGNLNFKTKYVKDADEAFEIVSKWLNENGIIPITDPDPIDSSIHIQLSKIVSNDTVDVRLKTIICSDMLSATDAIECVLSNNEFIDSLSEGESTYVITEDSEGYEVNPACDRHSSKGIYTLIFEATLQLRAQMAQIAWSVPKTIGYNNCINLDFIWNIDQLINLLAEQTISAEHHMPSIAEAFEHYTPIEIAYNYSDSTFFENLQCCISNYVDIITSLIKWSAIDDNVMISINSLLSELSIRLTDIDRINN